MKRAGFALSMVLAFAAVHAQAEVKLHGLFTDNMVLQRDAPIPVWGWANDGETVTVVFRGQSVAAQAQDGSWKAILDPAPAGGPHELSVQSNEHNVTLTNVMVGEVWVCSGQSNMEWSVANSANAEAEIENAHHPNIRLFTAPRQVAGAPQEDVEGRWSECSPSTVRGFSAVAYYFGRDLQHALGVPIGLIHSSWGGTPAEAWTPVEYLEAKEMYEPILERWRADLQRFPSQLSQLEDNYMQWVRNAERAEREGRPVPGYPSLPNDPRRSHWRPAGLFNAMIAPLTSYPIAGAIWYQGESNAGRAYQYRELFRDMIHSWRAAWNQGAFPFLFVQLANFQTQTPAGAWPELREAQTMALSMPNTGMAVAIDIGDPRDIHPRDKQTVGARLARSALGVAYKRDIAHSSPLYSEMAIEDGAITLTFQYVGSGLMKRGAGPLRDFIIAGEDGDFYPAEAEIVSPNQVRVSSPQVSEPVAVRYAWADDPEANLFNREGLPASPFRTDDWPGDTFENR